MPLTILLSEQKKEAPKGYADTYGQQKADGFKREEYYYKQQDQK